MFREWGFLLTEIWVLLALAALIGLLAGWIIWGRRSEVNIDTSEADRLRADLDACRSKHAEKDAEISDLRAQLASASASASAPVAVAAMPENSDYDGDRDYDGDGIVEGKDEGVKPSTLDAPRAGGADDLKKIKGVGPKMEGLCNALGFWHFDQIANWTDAEVAWVDANLEGFSGRVSRDNWVAQAALLAAGGETEFSKKVDKGGVY
jgi:predicted flap endonuclease-1-like 5' DNA nuclease